MKPDIIMDMGGNARATVLSQYMGKEDFNWVTNATVKSINNNSLIVEKDGAEETLDNIDTVIMAIGSKSNNKLMKALDEANVSYYAIGDCVKAPGQIMISVRDAFLLARNL